MNQSENTSLQDKLSSTFSETTNDLDTFKIHVQKDNWIEVATQLRDEHGLVFFSWLSAVDWENDVSFGEPPKEEVEPSFEILYCLSDITDGNFVVVSTKIKKENPSIASLIDVFPGANWHEREAFEMFGISFEGHPNLKRILLSEDWEGYPLRKNYKEPDYYHGVPVPKDKSYWD